jgi:putative salt-induced outer membrane protein YdiY
MRYGWVPRSITAAMALVIGSVAALADELVLKSGEKLTGTVVGIHGGKLQFKSESLGFIEVERAKVQTFATDGEVKVKDSKGRLRRGKAVKGEDGKVRFEAPFASSDPTVNKSPITAFASGEEMTVSEIAELSRVTDDRKGEWHGELMASATGTRSTTNTNEVDVRANGESESDTGRLRLWGWYEYAIHDREGFDSISKNNYGAGAQYDFKLQEGWYLFLKSQVKHDSIRELDREWLLAGGFGKTLVDANGVNFRAELGASSIDSRFTDGSEDRTDFNGYVAYYLRARLTDRVFLDHEFAWFPAFGSDKDNFFETWLGLSYEFEKNWSLSIRLTDEYHSLPADTASKNKFRTGSI